MIAKTGSSGTTVNEYDGFNQLVKTVTGNKESTYKYNGEGLRVEKTTGGATTRYLYEYDRIVLETDGSGAQTARNIYGMNLVSRKAGTQTLYYLYNGHADVTALIDSAGNIVVSYYYDPFGNILESTGTVNNPIRYAGYQYDEESGYYYLNARMYDPRIARFLQVDTYKGDVRDPLSLNLYAYCHNEPIMYWDPTGHYWTQQYVGSELQWIWINNGEYITENGKTVWVPNKSAILAGVDTSKDDFWDNEVFFGPNWGYDKNKEKIALKRLIDEANATGKSLNLADLVNENPRKLSAIRKALGLSANGELDRDVFDRLEAVDVTCNLPARENPLILDAEHLQGLQQYYLNGPYKTSFNGRAQIALEYFSQAIYEMAVFSAIYYGEAGKISQGNYKLSNSEIYKETGLSSDEFRVKVKAEFEKVTTEEIAVNFGKKTRMDLAVEKTLEEAKTNAGVGGVDDAVEITLRHKEGMPINEFNQKANALKELGDKGLLYKAPNPVVRDPSITRAYRQDMIKRIWKQYGKNNPEFANKLIDRVTKKMQPDHVWELQLGGPDTASNLKFLDSFTNWDIGTQQIRQQIKNLDDFTKIKIKIER